MTESDKMKVRPRLRQLPFIMTMGNALKCLLTGHLQLRNKGKNPGFYLIYFKVFLFFRLDLAGSEG